MSDIEKELKNLVREIVTEQLQEKKKLFASARWDKWSKDEDEVLRVELETFIGLLELHHGRTRNGILERLKHYIQ